MLPFEPESYEALAARFGEALIRVWDVGGEDRPGQHRRHVFDTTDGWRLIISRDDLGWSLCLHVSGSVANEEAIDLLKSKVQSKAQVIAVMLDEFKKISGFSETGVAEVIETKKGVLHLMYPWDDIEERIRWRHGFRTPN